tara:strand:- start:405 stop:506 length:102 start_codon:yes stop_codon:yes gene_type:complete
MDIHKSKEIKEKKQQANKTKSENKETRDRSKEN